MWLALNGLMQRHPNAIPIIARGGSYSPSAGEGTAGMVRIFKDAGLSPDEAAELLHILSACVVGFGFATLWGRQMAAAQEAAVAESGADEPRLRLRARRPTHLRRAARRLPPTTSPTTSRRSRSGIRRSSPRPSTSCWTRTGTAAAEPPLGAGQPARL